MHAFATTVVIFGFVYGGALLGMTLRAYLPERHYSSDSREAVRLGMGLVATTVALVLGLLIASAKGFYDTQNTEMTQAAANVVLLDRILVHYGPEATEARAVLRATVARLIDRSWQLDEKGKTHFDPTAASGEVIWDKIQELTPANDNQRSLRTQALELAIQLAQTRWLMFEQKASALPRPLLVILVAWLTLLFISFGLFIHPNLTVVLSLCASSLAVCSAIFLILEMYQPYVGVIRVSEAPLRAALAQLGQ
jgi:Kef-type K+ transport system membrane component KefB